MKKILSLIITILLLFTMLSLTGCSKSKVVVESVLEIDSEYVGHRQITVKYPLDAQIDTLSQTLTKNNPLSEMESSEFEYQGVASDGYVFVMDIAFDSHDEYISVMSELVGREVTSYMSQPSSVLATGTRMKEDFDVADIIGWMTELSENNESTKSLRYDYSVNTVSINGAVFNTDSTIDISDRQGAPISSITIETTNLKDGTYDRTITFMIPNKTYVDLSGSIVPYFASITSDAAQYSDWTNLGVNWEYKVIFKAITIDELSEYTAMLLDSNNGSAFYGDKNNSSTPLSEGLIFEESLNTFSFLSAEGTNVPLVYKYALPTKTTHGDGTVLKSGSWSTDGAWQDGIYAVAVDSDTTKIRIPDGIQYAINGINMDLEVVSENQFVRTTDFLYSKTQGFDGMLYAQNYFEERGATVVTGEDEDNLICSVVCTGSAAEITDQLVTYFGSGNFMAYDISEASFALSTKTELTDYVNLGYMLNSTNANRPITYTVHTASDENIIDLVCDDKDSVRVSENSDALIVDVEGGQGTVVYNGSIPDVLNIIIYCIICALMLSLTVAVIVYMLKKQHKKPDDKSDDSSFAPQQTTTFSITELQRLSDKDNKELREQIDKDVEEKMEADRIETLSKELKEKELSQLSEMVYGDSEEKADTKEEEE